jgi:hypothetical protein
MLFEALENSIKTIDLRWLHKIDAYHMEEIKSVSDGAYKIRWYRYTPGIGADLQDNYGGENWELLTLPERPEGEEDKEEIRNSNSDLIKTDIPKLTP